MRTVTGLNVTVWGEGEPVVLVHGSFGWGEKTWAEQRPLADSYRLLLPDRRGFGASRADGRVDFERDADDIAELLNGETHLVGHSYGGVVALLAATRDPDAVRSLTVIEPPALGFARGDPVVEEFIAAAKIAMEEATGPSNYRVRFLHAFGLPAREVELEGLELEAARASWHERPPWEAEISLDALRGLPTLVVRGDWQNTARRARKLGGKALHAVCDTLEERLGGERAVLAAAHNPQLLGEPFNERLRAFWESV